MLEDPSRYPLLRGRRRRGLRGRLTRGGWRASRWGAVFLVAMALVGAALLIRHALRPDPRVELANSLRLMDAGAYSAARAAARQAVAGDTKDGTGHAVLARAELLMGNGPAADGELARAIAAGFDGGRLHQLIAEAALLQGDPDRALAQAARARVPYRAYADRIAARAKAMKGDASAGRAMLGGVLARWPRDGLAWRDLAQVKLEAGDLGGANAAAAQAAALLPGEPGVLVLQGELVRAREGLLAALPWFDAALVRDAGYVPALVERAATLGEAGRYAEMLAATRAALVERPGETHALYLDAVLAARAGKRDLSRALLARTNGAIDHLSGASLLQGSLDYADGRYEQAIGRWRELLDRQPTNLVARRLLGAALLRSGDARGALDVLRPAIARGDADSYSLALATRSLEALGDRAGAAALLDRAGGGVDASPFAVDGGVPAAAEAARTHAGDPARLVELIRALLATGRRDEALADARMLVRGGPGAPAAWLVLGDVEVAAGRSGAAVDAYRRAAALRFDEPTMLRLTDALARTGARGRAAEVVALYWSQNPDSIAAMRLAAELQISGGAWTAAIRTLERAWARGGGRDAALLVALATAHGGMGDWARSRDEARAAYRLAPGDAAATDAYGWAMFRTGDAAGAAALLRKAAEISPRSVGIRTRLARVLGPLPSR